jgi:hypothetical protein
MATNHYRTEEFYISEGGPYHNAIMKMHLHNRVFKLAFLILCITWLPLVIITFFEGTLYTGVQLPFLKDVDMQARILVAMPMLVLIKRIIDIKVAKVVDYLPHSLLSPEEWQGQFTSVLDRVRKVINSKYIEIALLLTIVTVNVLFKGSFVFNLEDTTTSWRVRTAPGIHELSIAARWAFFVSVPVFQFLFVRWLLRYFIWVWLLYRLSKTNLNLVVTHADRSGGLGILSLAQQGFMYIFVALGIVVSGEFITQLLIDPSAFPVIRNEAMGYIILCILLIILPLFFFNNKLLDLKHEAQFKMSDLSADLSREFEKHWLSDLPIGERLVGKEANSSMLMDYQSMYDVLLQLRTVPVNLRDIIAMGVLLLIPFLPILVIHFSVAELVSKIVGMVV